MTEIIIVKNWEFRSGALKSQKQGNIFRNKGHHQAALEISREFLTRRNRQDENTARGTGGTNRAAQIDTGRRLLHIHGGFRCSLCRCAPFFPPFAVRTLYVAPKFCNPKTATAAIRVRTMYARSQHILPPPPRSVRLRVQATTFDM